MRPTPAITIVERGKAEGVREVAEAVETPGGYQAAQLRVAEQHVEKLGLLAKENDTMIVPITVGGVSSSTRQLLREHLRTQRGWHRVADDDRPARTPPKTLALLAAAKRAGPAISTVCDQHPPA